MAALPLRQSLPHERVEIVAGDRFTSQLVYRDLDTGDVFRVPNGRHNLLPLARLAAQVRDNVWWSYLAGRAARRYHETATHSGRATDRHLADAAAARAAAFLAAARAHCADLARRTGTPLALDSVERELGVQVQ